MKISRLIFICIFFHSFIQLFSQSYTFGDEYLRINASGGDPVYTTYTAAIERARLYGDKGYKMNYDDDKRPLTYGSEVGGRIYTIWEINNVVVSNTGDFHRKPVITASFPDLVILDYEPWPGLKAEEVFMVYSSSVALVECVLENTGNEHLTINYYPVLEGADSLEAISFDRQKNMFRARHYETRKRLISNLPDKYPYPTHLTDIFSAGFPAYSFGAYNGGMDDFYNAVKTDFYSDDRSDSLNLKDTGYADFLSLHGKFYLKPGEKMKFRYCRALEDEEIQQDNLEDEVNIALNINIQNFIDEDIRLFSHIPRIRFIDPEDKMVYLSAFNLARGSMLPPSGETSYNFYVFSREPIWGWGHGHQVLHESLSMLAYVYLDPLSAENSQRVFMEQQGDDGLIAYRHGPRGAQTYPHKDMPTTSAPFFSWINWEVYKVSHDRQFLQEAYESGIKYANWLIKNRDTDNDGTFEWGPYGIIENVRDWYNAVFQVSAERYLDVDKEDISDELECLDLSLMMVKELKCLSEMANLLNLKLESRNWEEKADSISNLINQRMWDEASGFYYSVNKNDHSFYFMTRDLKRQEIIGFLPLWAEATDKARAAKLIETLTDTTKFWRCYGIPTLSATDEWYSPYVDYCCKWNGPVWLLWDYMVYEGLKNYGYERLAAELADKMTAAVKLQLEKNHSFRESYSPDNEVLNCPSNYIWDSIIARLMIESSGY